MMGILSVFCKISWRFAVPIYVVYIFLLEMDIAFLSTNIHFSLKFHNIHPQHCDVFTVWEIVKYNNV